ncbi:MAG: hypothetical protein E7676_05815 [Ruminococcaceae bacterium]|nr:hypothetical protein [Oscillospiraceae bacterium]
MRKSTLFLIFTLVLALLISIAAFSSCRLFIPKNSQSENEVETPKSEDLIWSSEHNYYIVCEDETTDIGDFRYHLYLLVGKAPEIITAENMSATPNDHEIVVGKFNRPISMTAYEKFDKIVDLFSLESNGDSAYLVYAENGSMAIAYSDSIARMAALNWIQDNITDKEYSASGVITHERFNTIDFVAARRNEQRDKEFEEILNDSSNFERVTAEGISALRNLYNIYTEELYIWLANLYDPNIGGFYYSASARNTEGFLPDIESTVQALELLQNSGLANTAGGSYANLLSGETLSQISEFIVGLQAEDGYFYHPQWGTSIGSSRRGRDHGWAVRFFNATGVVPIYDSPTGAFKGSGIVGSSHSLLPSPLGSSVAVSTSKVVLTASTNPIYASEESFKIYLDGLFAKGDSYSAANALSSTSGEIKSAGRWDYLLNYLRTNQKENGLWENEVSYNSINGLMKLSEFFGKNFPKADASIESTLEIIMLDISDDVETMCYVYNPWVCLANILPSCSAEGRARFEVFLRENMYDLVQKTTEKLIAFARTDGGFSMNQDSTSATSQGVLVAVKGTLESDVNSTAIAVSTVIKNLFTVYEIDAPALYCRYDTTFFLDVLAGLGTIIKNSGSKVEPEVVTFDNYNPSEGNEVNGLVYKPDEAVINNVGDTDNKWFMSSIVPNPDPNFDDMVLYAEDFVYPDNPYKSVAAVGSNTECLITNLGTVGNCYILDVDLYFAGSDGSNPVMQIVAARQGTNSQNSVVLNLYTYERYGKTFLRVADSYAGRDGIQNGEVVGGIPTGEWFNLRVEVYKNYTENEALDVKIKLYLNGEYAGMSDSSLYNATDDTYYDRDISSFKLAYYRMGASAFYINNVYTAKENKPYVEETAKDSDNSELDDQKTVYDFTTGIISNDDFFIEQFYKDADLGKFVSIDPVNWTSELESKYGIGTNKGGVRFYAAADPTNSSNKVLRIFTQNLDNNSGNGTVYINDSNLSSDGTTYEVSLDYYFDTIDFLWRANEFNLEFQNSAGSKLFGFAFDAKEIPESHGGMSEMVIKTDDGKVIENFTLKSGKWYSMKFEYYYDSELPANSRVKIYLCDINGDYVCIYDEIIANASAAVSQLGIRFSAYKIRGNQYLDNISFAKTDKKYTSETVVKGDDVAISGMTNGDSSANESAGNTSVPTKESSNMDNEWAENDS